MRLLLVEDDALLAEGIQSALEHFSYQIDHLDGGNLVISALDNNHFDLVILDLGLPDMDGIDVLKTLREKGHTLPVLILTARDQTDDKIYGLDSGADDYLVKPFDVRELDARIRTLLRRSSGRSTNQIKVGRAVLDTDSRKIILDSKNIEFSRREYMLIETFFTRPDKVFTREFLESKSYGWDDEVESNALEVHIHNLRKKLGSGAIKTIRGVGYMLVEEHFA